MNFAVNARLIQTLADIGPRRVQRRLRYELRQRLDRRLPPRIALAWAGDCSGTPPWLPVLRSLELPGSQLTALNPPHKVSLTFCSRERTLVADPLERSLLASPLAVSPPLLRLGSGLV